MAKYYKLMDDKTDLLAIYTVEDVEPLNGSDFSLEELQGYVDGLIEVVALNDGRIMVVNEEGYINDLPINPLATAIFQEQTGSREYIVGSALICDAEQVQ